ncbi:MAG: zf-HC2 domain-containing protein [Desulfobaccales bacterium]|nr:zf-HC2 domain-containing protein [Desulfobaccales bacterium]
MSWRCKILKRWLPEYPDGELPAFWKRQLTSHLEGCPACRQELAAFKEVVAAVQATPVKDPGQEFWDAFNRQLHLKLAQAAQEVQVALEAPSRRRFKIPYYILGAPALAVLVLWIAAHLTEPQKPVLTQPPMAQEAPQAPMAKEAPPARVAQEPSQEQIVFAGMGNGLWQEEEELPDWDPDPVIADLNDQEREIFLKKLKAKAKDGSWLPVCFSDSWA